jgi:hypothetical protein
MTRRCTDYHHDRATETAALDQSWRMVVDITGLLEAHLE